MITLEDIGSRQIHNIDIKLKREHMPKNSDSLASFTIILSASLYLESQFSKQDWSEYRLDSEISALQQKHQDEHFRFVRD
ncbi:unnamed protein product [Fusarium venenatum]|uniref:Uncharacterized protein n=1 Tax=Fusarium venenatum TaxID=56646 RepID=A0A2L2TYK5_9HYPO|nr:uncharacterized protein FVRRES_10113 [Fusarium venenatum]CEI70036.1 unnamed protein product [Fusarium venenatum]